jgi:hypothetical protein
VKPKRRMMMPRRRKYTRVPLEARFESKYIPEPNSGCWLWMGALLPFGYGVLGAGGHTGTIRAHHAAWRIYRGDIPAGMWVLHKCDVPSCVNPDHLFLGTHQDNMRDCRQKGRSTYGDRSGTTRLRNDQAIEIFRSQEPANDVATRFGVSPMTVFAIRAGRSWSRVTKGAAS